MQFGRTASQYNTSETGPMFEQFWKDCRRDENHIPKGSGFVTFQSEGDVKNVTVMGTLFLRNKQSSYSIKSIYLKAMDLLLFNLRKM